MMTKAYAENRAKGLVRDHNDYNKMGYKAAVKDYRTALDCLIYVAGRCGYKIEYKVKRNGNIELI